VPSRGNEKVAAVSLFHCGENKRIDDAVFYVALSGDEQPLAPRAGSLLMRNAPSQTLLGDESERERNNRKIYYRESRSGGQQLFNINPHTRKGNWSRVMLFQDDLFLLFFYLI